MRRGEAFRRHRILPKLFSYIDRDRTSEVMSTAVLRLLTFEALHLTHTCCYRVHEEINGKFVRPTTEEAEVIRDLERADLEFLESLVAEFETKWFTYIRSFPTFMNRVWKPRMRAVHQARKIDKELYQAELRRMGVTLRDAADRNEWEYESESDEGEESDSEGDGWYTTDEEADEMDEEGNMYEMEDSGVGALCGDDGEDGSAEVGADRT
jgi:hypothetical protein